MSLVDITPTAFDLTFDLRYASADNLTGAPIYNEARARLHPEAAAALQQAVTCAGGMHLRLRLFDAFRSPEAQWRLWQALPDPTYIADPRTGSTHTRGVAVDLTLETRDGRPLDMGTAFDDMTPRAHHGPASAVSITAQQNRALLAGIMSLAGFEPYRFEWWHYQLPNASRYPLLEAGG